MSFFPNSSYPPLQLVFPSFLVGDSSYSFINGSAPAVPTYNHIASDISFVSDWVSIIDIDQPMCFLVTSPTCDLWIPILFTSYSSINSGTTSPMSLAFWSNADLYIDAQECNNSLPFACYYPNPQFTWNTYLNATGMPLSTTYVYYQDSLPDILGNSSAPVWCPNPWELCIDPLLFSCTGSTDPTTGDMALFGIYNLLSWQYNKPIITTSSFSYSSGDVETINSAFVGVYSTISIVVGLAFIGFLFKKLFAYVIK